MITSTEPAKGMRDYLPAHTIIRKNIEKKILDDFWKFGFDPIETPVMENIKNLENEITENEKLTFKVLKRGKKIQKVIDNILSAHKNEYCDTSIWKTQLPNVSNILSDLFLRYDLTIPLNRYIANNKHNLCEHQKLIWPLKLCQIGDVWRAERPQKSRLRQFTQADVDICGDPSVLSELHVINTVLQSIRGIGDNRVKYSLVINDRKCLLNILEGLEISAKFHMPIQICLDKIDKIGSQEVFNLVLQECSNEHQYILKVEKLFNILNCIQQYCNDCITCKHKNSDGLHTILNSVGLSKTQYTAINTSVDNLIDFGLACQMIISSDKKPNNETKALLVNPFMTRGMNYYSGIVFEVKVDNIPFSFAGGGRYDNMYHHKKESLNHICGMSIGVDRLYELLFNTNCINKSLIDKPYCEKLTTRYPIILVHPTHSESLSNILLMVQKTQTLFPDFLYSFAYSKNTENFSKNSLEIYKKLGYDKVYKYGKDCTLTKILP